MARTGCMVARSGIVVTRTVKTADGGGRMEVATVVTVGMGIRVAAETVAMEARAVLTAAREAMDETVHPAAMTSTGRSATEETGATVATEKMAEGTVVMAVWVDMLQGTI